MRMPALILTVVAATLLIAPASPQDGGNPSRKDQIQESARKVKDLQQKRIAILKKMVEQSTVQFQRALVSYDAVYEAGQLLLHAELDAAEKESDRITLYKNMINLMENWEKLAQAKFESGRGTELAVLKFRAGILEAKINLERAKAKEAQGAR